MGSREGLGGCSQSIREEFPYAKGSFSLGLMVSGSRVQFSKDYYMGFGIWEVDPVKLRSK